MHQAISISLTFIYRVQANYIMWRVAASKMGYLTEEAEKIGLKQYRDSVHL